MVDFVPTLNNDKIELDKRILKLKYKILQDINFYNSDKLIKQ